MEPLLETGFNWPSPSDHLREMAQGVVESIQRSDPRDELWDNVDMLMIAIQLFDESRNHKTAHLQAME
ncbi:MAG TPA: hypothetical protein PKC18_17485 [Lacipirellulaceae bacterium]|nr:hypothetical protein [Lacipirellulaceae bacterium]